MACLNEIHCTTRIQSLVFHLRRLHCPSIHPLSLSCRTDHQGDSLGTIFVLREYKRKQAMCPHNAINPRAYTAISTPNTKPQQISKHHTITKSASSKKEKQKNPSCSQCKASSICAWNPFRVMKNTQSTPDQTRSLLYGQETSLTKATLVTPLAQFAWISTKTATDGRGRSVSALTARVRIRNGNYVTYQVRRLHHRRRGESVGRCECPSPSPYLTTDEESLG